LRILEIAICDDDSQIIEKVKLICEKYLFNREINCNIWGFSNGSHLLNSDTSYDI
jgi:hypothetical protein